MAELIPTKDEADWLAARRQGITASEIAVIMGLSPWSSPYALYHQKLGILPRQEDSPAMERGRVLEPYIREKFAEAHPEFAVMGFGRDLYAHAERRWQMATLDSLLYAKDGNSYFDLEEPVAVTEFKTASSMDEWGEPGTDEIPVHYRCQVLWQMDVMGVAKAHVAVLDIPRWRVLEYVVEMDGDARHDLALMHKAAHDFLDRIECQEPPDVDWRPATIAALKTMNPGVEDREVVIGRQLAISYRAAQRRYKEAEQRKDEMTARVLETMGNAKRAVEANTETALATRSVSHPERIDTERLRSEQPAIAAEYTKPPKPEVKLTPAKPKKVKKSVSANSK